VFTAGSPIESLYARFLGSTLEARARSFPDLPEGLTETEERFQKPVPWINFSRSADYIGDEQNDASRELPLDSGTHTGYWMLPEMWNQIATQLSALPTTPAQ
jgi:hypothetical protein